MEHGEASSSKAAAREIGSSVPDRWMGIVRGFMPSRCLLTALELDVFTAVGEGADCKTIASRIPAQPRATGLLLNALAALGLLTKEGEFYRNTPEAARYFAKGSPDNHRDSLLHTANLWHRWGTLTEVVRGGRSTRVRTEENPEWTRNFIVAMNRNANERVPLLVKTLGGPQVRRILDLGGGSGAYSIAFAKALPGVLCEILDLPEVVPLTEQYIREAGASAQVKVRAGNMLTDDYGSGFDLVMLNAICHSFSEDQNREIFRRALRALAPKGRLCVQEFILDPGKTSPMHSVLFAINMLVGTEGGNTYTEAEITQWMREAGFTDAQGVSLPGPTDLVVGVAP